MKKAVLLSILFLMVVGFSEGSDPVFLSHPTLYPDGSRIVFSFANDLWTVSSQGGIALRLTAMEGRETHPRISPDGRWLAFSSDRNGNADVYLMPLKGGAITQLTVHESDDYLDSWSWDSHRLYFHSNRYNNFSEYEISVKGGTPRRLFGNYFNTIHGVVVHPLTDRFYFTDTWESLRFANRKGYRGAYNPDIKSYYPPTRDFQVHTTYDGKDFSPVIDRSGNIYFVSDEQTGEFNLFRLDLDKKVALTRFSTSIRHPQVAANGEAVVFEKDYRIFLYDVKREASREVKVQLTTDGFLDVAQDFNLKKNITDFDVSPDNQKIALVSRGQLFVSDVKGQFVRQLEVGPQRVVEVHWLKDSRSLIFNQTVSGYLNWFRISALDEGSKTALTRDRANNRNLSFNKTGTKGVYYSGRNQVRLMDLTTFKSRLLLEDELWGFRNSPARFSPDDRYLVFTVFRNFEQDIIIYDFSNEKAVNITRSGTGESEPAWSPDGRYLYFVADRTEPRFPRGGNNPDLYRLALQKMDAEFRSDKFEELFKEKENGKQKDKEEKPEPVRVTIDFEHLMDRWEQLEPTAGWQHKPFLAPQEDKTLLFFASNHEGAGYYIYRKTFHPFEETKLMKISSPPVSDLQIREAKDHYYLLIKGTVYTMDSKTGKTKPVELSYPFAKNMSEEFEQMFYETWANLEENFYDPDFHGRNWEDIGDRYAAYLPYLNSRADLRRLISDMLGELNSSHLGFYSSGKEEETHHRQHTLETGIIFRESEPYTVDYILRRSPAESRHVRIKAGDRLTAVNGQKVDRRMNRNAYFTFPYRPQEIELTFQREGGMIFTTQIHTQSPAKLKSLLYDRWQDVNQERVDEWGDGRIAYVHMKNMGGGELKRFIIDMATEWYRRQGLILDLRYNTGGNVHDDVLHFLIQKPYLKWKYRGGRYSPQPNFAPAGKPIVLLINEQSLSDAEVTAAGFKALQLGTVIGTETYRWIIFTTGSRLVDGSYYRLPCWGCFTLDGRDLEKEGVRPDIPVRNTFRDRLLGRDPQLKRAVEEILKQLDG